jgi:predicted NBD/HSP70 family sugar kinase
VAQKRVNPAQATSRGIVLDIIRTIGPISRIELAEKTGLTQATMSNVVRQLLDDELVVETGRRESTGGKRRVLLDINPLARFAVGVQLGRESITYIATNLGGAIVGRLRTEGSGDLEPADVVTKITAQVASLLARLDIDTGLVVGVGLVAPGPVDREAGTLLGPPSLPAWQSFPLRAALQEALELPVLLDNDATAAAIGEYWGGAIAGSLSHATVYMGSGIGAGIVLDGSVFRGSSSNAGELGQVTVAIADGRRLTLEQLAAPEAVVAAARQRIAGGEGAGFTLPADSTPFADFTLLATAATRGDDFATRILTEAADHLATAVVTMANLFDLDSIALAGPAFGKAGALYLRVIAERVDAEFFPRARHRTVVTLSTNAADAAAAGAAALILQQELAPRGA